MSKRLKVALLYGGRSGEHEVSLVSAASILAHLNPERYDIIPIGMGKDGSYYVNDYHALIQLKGPLPIMAEGSYALESLVHNGRLAVDTDVVFPMAHGPLYEDGSLQGLLELTNTAYVGCDVLSSAIGMDKDIARRLVRGLGIASARYRSLSWHASAQETERFCHQIVSELGWPLFVKPCSMGSSVGISKANTMSELVAAVADARRYDETILVEEYIVGREIELSVLESLLPSEPPEVSIPGEIRVGHVDSFYSYAAKYIESEHTELIIPAELDLVLVGRLQAIAAQIFTGLKCKGMARVDLFLDDKNGTVYFNEVNTIPGFTAISMYPKLWMNSGLPYPALLDRLIDLALVHHGCRQQLVTHYR